MVRGWHFTKQAVGASQRTAVPNTSTRPPYGRGNHVWFMNIPPRPTLPPPPYPQTPAQKAASVEIREIGNQPPPDAHRAGGILSSIQRRKIRVLHARLERETGAQSSAESPSASSLTPGWPARVKEVHRDRPAAHLHLRPYTLTTGMPLLAQPRELPQKPAGQAGGARVDHVVAYPAIWRSPISTAGSVR